LIEFHKNTENQKFSKTDVSGELLSFNGYCWSYPANVQPFSDTRL